MKRKLYGNEREAILNHVQQPSQSYLWLQPQITPSAEVQNISAINESTLCLMASWRRENNIKELLDNDDNG